MRTGPRRRAAVAALALVGGALGAVAPMGAAPAYAEPGCLDETPPPPPVPLPIPLPVPVVSQDGCDDSTPPDTSLAASPTPDAGGLVAAGQMTFTFASPPPADGDRDLVGFECRLQGSAQAHDFRQCTSPVTYTGLPDAAAGAYTFTVRAVDLGDAGRTPDVPGNAATTADTPDLDATPPSVAWGADTKAPIVFVTFDAYDEKTPTQPVVTSRDVPLRLDSNERGGRFECTDNGVAVACQGGKWTLTGAASGRHVFSARAVDAAGNAGAWSPPVEFFVPVDLERRKGWSTLVDRGWFDGDAVTTRTRGARLVLPRTTVGELRLYAPTGPRYGKVRVRVGRRAWHVVSLQGPKAAMRELVVLDRYSGLRRGRIVIEALGSRRVVLDAVVARLNTFPAATKGAPGPS